MLATQRKIRSGKTAIYTSQQQFYLHQLPLVFIQFNHVLQNLIDVFYFREKQKADKETC